MRLIELLRSEKQLVRLAEAYDDDSGLPGLAGIFVATMHSFRVDAGGPATALAEAEDVYAAAGLYALLAIGARGDDDPREAAKVAYSLLPRAIIDLRRTV